MDADQKLFKENNQALFFSTRFLPKVARDDISKLYGFVFVSKNYAKSKSTHASLLKLKKSYENALADHAFDAIAHNWDDQDIRIIKNIVHLQHKYKFDQVWVDGYFKSLIQDIDNPTYKNFDQSVNFISGSTEPIGYMVSKILNLSEDVNKFVVAQCRASQWLDFIKNISKDSIRDKCYFPNDELKKYGLKDLKAETIKLNESSFNKFIQFQLSRYQKWQSEAKKGIGLIPERDQVAIRTAINMDEWIAKKIEKVPNIIYEKTLQPKKRRIIRQVIKNTARGTARVTVRTTKQVKAGVKGVKPATKAAVPKIKQAPKIAKEKAIELKDKYIETED